jgi:hypothetical protein
MKSGGSPDEAVCGIPVIDGRGRSGQAFDSVGKATDFGKDQGVLVFSHRFLLNIGQESRKMRALSCRVSCSFGS